MPDFDEHPFYFGQPGQRMFGMLHRPAVGAPLKDAGWVFCSAFAEERSQSHRVMAEWARVLCAEGFCVLRFDYRGYGDSDGVFEDFTIDDCLDDIAIAIAELERRAGVPCRGLCGLRLGAALAAIAGPRHASDPMLVLWEPVVDGAQYADDELLRSVLAKRMKDAGEAPVTRAQLKESLLAGGEVAVLGHSLNKAIYESLTAIDLLAQPLRGEGPARIVRITNRPKGRIPKQLAAFHEACATRGLASIECARVLPLPWQHAIKEYNVRPEALFAPTLEWVREHFEERPQDTATTAEGEFANTNGAERIVEIDVEGERTWGILHIPDGYAPDAPVVLMLSIAENCRTANARFYVRLARELGQRGWASLRIDPRGIGDSEGRLDATLVPELYLLFQRGSLVPGARAAIGFLERELGTHPIILTGICGGAITSIIHGGEDPRVTAIAPLEPALLYDVQPGLGEASAATRRALQDKLLSWQPAFTREYARRFLSALRRTYGRLTLIAKGGKSIQPFVDRLGPRANTNILTGLLKCAERGMPIMGVFAETWDAEAFEGLLPDLRRAYGDSADRLQYHKVAKADHLFTEPAHGDEVIQTLIGWLTDLNAAAAQPPRSRRP